MDNDSNATIQDLRQLLVQFRDERDWAKFHDPKNLAEAISIEAGQRKPMELLKLTPKMGRITEGAREIKLFKDSHLFV